MIETVHYRGQITKSLYLKAHRVHFASNWLRFVVPLFLPPAVIVGLAFSGSFAGVNPWNQVIGALLLPPTMMGLWFWQLRRHYRHSSYAAGRVEGELSATGVTIRFVNASSDLSWRLFERVGHSPGIMLLYQSPTTFYILSRELFVAEAAWHMAVALVNEHIARSKNPRTA
jgi:hypothetical protein